MMPRMVMPSFDSVASRTIATKFDNLFEYREDQSHDHTHNPPPQRNRSTPSPDPFPEASGKGSAFDETGISP